MNWYGKNSSVFNCWVKQSWYNNIKIKCGYRTALGETNAMNNLDNVVNNNGKSKPE